MCSFTSPVPAPSPCLNTLLLPPVNLLSFILPPSASHTILNASFSHASFPPAIPGFPLPSSSPHSSFFPPPPTPFASLPFLPIPINPPTTTNKPPPLPGPAWRWGGSRGEGGRWWRWVYWWWGWLWARAAADAIQPACQSTHSGSCPVSPPGGAQVVQQGLRTYMHMSAHTTTCGSNSMCKRL